MENLQLERKTKKSYFSDQRKWRESFSDVLKQHLDKKNYNKRGKMEEFDRKKNLVKWKIGKTHVHRFAKKRSIF